MPPLPKLSINLLTARQHSYDKYVQTSQRAKIYAGMVLVLYLGIIMVVFAADAFMKAQSNGLDSEANKLKLAIFSQATNEEKLSTVASKAKSIAGILSRRQLISKIWNSILTMMPEGVELEKFSMSGQEVRLSFNAPHVVKTTAILDILENDRQGFAVTKSEVLVSRSEDATYKLQVTMLLSANSRE